MALFAPVEIICYPFRTSSRWLRLALVCLREYSSIIRLFLLNNCGQIDKQLWRTRHSV